MARVETDDIIEKEVDTGEDITIHEEDKQNAELLSLEKIEKDLLDNKSNAKKDNWFIIVVLGAIALFIVLLPILFK